MAANNTYFFRNDAIFPEDLAYIIKKKCSENGIYFLNKGDYIIIGIRFKDDYEYHDEKIIYAVKIKNDKKLNYWSDMIYDGKHHYSGPGYPSNAIHEQSPISKEDFINIIDTEIEHMKRKKEMFSENTIKKTYKLTETRLSELIAESVKKVLKEDYDWEHYNDGPSIEEDTFKNELRSVIEGYGLAVARYYGNKDFVRWCVDVINDVLNDNKKLLEPGIEPEPRMRGEY